MGERGKNTRYYSLKEEFKFSRKYMKYITMDITNITREREG